MTHNQQMGTKNTPFFSADEEEVDEYLADDDELHKMDEPSLVEAIKTTNEQIDHRHSLQCTMPMIQVLPLTRPPRPLLLLHTNLP